MAQILREGDERVRQAREQAEERVKRERLAAEAESRKTVEDAEQRAAARSDAAHDAAEQAQERVRPSRAANETVATARDLADRASKAARQAAAQASSEADRLAAQAQDSAAEAERRAAEAGQVRQRAGGVGPRVPKRRPAKSARHGKSGKLGNGRPSAPKRATRRSADIVGDKARLAALTKNELLRRAADLEIRGHAAMTKPELVAAVTRAGVGTSAR